MAESATQEPGFFMKIAKGMYRPGEFMAMWRELLKDLQSTFNQVAFGQPAHASEPNTPLNPTMQVVTSEFLGKPLKPGEKALENAGTAKVLDMPEPTQAPTREMTLDELRGYAKEKSQEALQKMEKWHSNGQSKQQERGGIEM